jgi:hypothetical protein
MILSPTFRGPKFEIFSAVKASPTLLTFITVSPKMATSNSFLNFGKKIYRTKPALLNNPSHLPALPHEYKFSQ